MFLQVGAGVQVSVRSRVCERVLCAHHKKEKGGCAVNRVILPSRSGTKL